MTARARSGPSAGSREARRRAAQAAVGEGSPTPGKGREVAAAFSPGDQQVLKCRGIPDPGSSSAGWN